MGDLGAYPILFIQCYSVREPISFELDVTHHRSSVLDAKPAQSVSSSAMWVGGCD